MPSGAVLPGSPTASHTRVHGAWCVSDCAGLCPTGQIRERLLPQGSCDGLAPDQLSISGMADGRQFPFAKCQHPNKTWTNCSAASSFPMMCAAFWTNRAAATGAGRPPPGPATSIAPRARHGCVCVGGGGGGIACTAHDTHTHTHGPPSLVLRTTELKRPIVYAQSATTQAPHTPSPARAWSRARACTQIHRCPHCHKRAPPWASATAQPRACARTRSRARAAASSTPPP